MLPAAQDNAPPSRLQLPDWPRLMSVGYAAAYLSVSASTVRTLGLPTYNIGRRVLYDRKLIDRWIDGELARDADPRGRLISADDQRLLELIEERKFLERRAAKQAEAAANSEPKPKHAPKRSHSNG